LFMGMMMMIGFSLCERFHRVVFT
jgi:hypothetical protein